MLSQKDGLKKEEIAHFFHSDYHQYVDGQHLDYDGFVAHMNAQKKVIEEMNVFFKTIVQEGSIVFTNHEVSIKKEDGNQIKIHVIAEFVFEGDKIIHCDELTHLMEGRDEDRNIGSRTH